MPPVAPRVPSGVGSSAMARDPTRWPVTELALPDGRPLLAGLEQRCREAVTGLSPHTAVALDRVAGV